MKRWEADGTIPGLGILVLPSGVKTWYLRYREPNGKQRTKRIGPSPGMNRTLARNLAKVILGDAASGVQPFHCDTTIAQLMDLLQQRHYSSLRQATLAAYRCYWKNDVLPVIGHRKVTDVQRPEILQLLSTIKGAKSNRVLQMLKSAFNQAEIWGLRPENSNPCRRIKPQPERMRRRYLTQQEVELLMDACDTPDLTPERWRFTRLIKLLLFTGARLNEIKAARWAWVSTKAATLTVPPEHHKTGADGHQRTIYLSPPALAVLDELREETDSEWIIAGRGNGPLIGVGKMWRQMIKHAGIENLRIHDLRHSYASLAVSAGLSLPQIGGLLGHASPVTTARYAHLIDSTAASAAAKVAAQIKSPR